MPRLNNSYIQRGLVEMSDRVYAVEENGQYRRLSKKLEKAVREIRASGRRRHWEHEPDEDSDA